MFILNSQFFIGKYKFTGCNEVSIKKSIHEIADTATIRLPNSYVLKLKKVTTLSASTAKAFKVGDAVTIRLGYNGQLKDEFVGFIKRINYKTPCELECEGYSYILRTKTNIVKSWKSTTLLEVLQFVTANTDIKLHSAIPDMPLKNLKINNANGLEVIDYIKSLLGGVLKTFFIGDTLYCGLAYMDLAQTTVKYRLGWNTIEDANLKYRQAADVKVKIELEYRQGNGQQMVVSSGAEGGTVKREKMSAVTDPAKLQAIADAKLRDENYDGYEGDITTLLLPVAQPGYRAALTDPRYEERQGNYFVESTETTYGQSGARRKVQIGIKLA
jgi:hypothetical protein